MTIRKVYISGPITGRENENREAFMLAEIFLKSKGFEVVNPIRIGDNLLNEKLKIIHPAETRSNISWEDYMCADIPELCNCDAIVAIDGWNSSKGATLELALAFFLKKKMYFLNNEKLEELNQSFLIQKY